MTNTTKIHAKHVINMSDLKAITCQDLKKIGGSAVTVLSHHKPVAYILSPENYEALLNKVEELELTKIAKARLKGKSVEVKLSRA